MWILKPVWSHTTLELREFIHLYIYNQTNIIYAIRFRKFY